MRKQSSKIVALVTGVQWIASTLVLPMGYADNVNPNASTSYNSLSGAVTPVSGAEAVIGSIQGVANGLFANQAAVPNFAMGQTGLDASIAACLKNSGLEATVNQGLVDLEALNELNKKNQEKRSKYNSQSSTPDKTTSADDLVCAASTQTCTGDLPPEPKEPSCSAFIKPDAASNKGRIKGEDKYYVAEDGKLKRARDMAQKYACALDFRYKHCAAKELADIRNQYKALNCQMQAMQKSVQDASSALQQSLTQTASKYGEMNLFQSEVEGQLKQVNEILGPDPELGQSGNAQFSGLLGLEQKMTESLQKFRAKEAEFDTMVDNQKQAEEAADQSLDAARMGQVTNCMTGNASGMSVGSASAPLLCFKPKMQPSSSGAKNPDGSLVMEAVMGANGPVYVKQMCSPVEYTRAQAVQGAFLNGRGEVMMSSSRRDEAQERGAMFDSAMQEIFRDLGAVDPNKTLKTHVNSWEEYEAAFGSKLAALSQKLNFDVKTSLGVTTRRCFFEGQRWKRQQLTSQNSPYQQQKRELKKSRDQITGELDNNLALINRDWSAAMGVLGNRHATLSRVTCTKDKIEDMKKCHREIRQNLDDLLEGNGQKTMTSKIIQGGEMAKGFTVACAGIRGCIQEMKNVRDTQKQVIAKVAQQRVKWAQVGNMQTQQKMQMFAQGLSQQQQMMKIQYAKLGELARKMGAKDFPTEPNYKEAATLEQMEGPNGEKGPYKMPTSMDAAISSMMSPGLLDFTNPGFDKAMNAVQETAEAKETKAKEAAQKAAELLAKFTDIDHEVEDACGKGSVSARNGEKGETKGLTLGTNDCINCNKMMNACKKEKGANQYQESFATILEALNDIEGDSEKLNQANKEIFKLSDLDKGQCVGIDNMCMNCIDGKTRKSPEYEKEAEGKGGTAGSANGTITCPNNQTIDPITGKCK